MCWMPFASLFFQPFKIFRGYSANRALIFMFLDDCKKIIVRFLSAVKFDMMLLNILYTVKTKSRPHRRS